ncbi:MAG: beta-propeller fold lactonase family protein [Terriglobales bacterium]
MSLTKVPGPFRARKGPASLVVTAGTKAIAYTPTFAYVADFSGGVPTLSVNASSGALTTITGSPFGSGTDPRQVVVTPNGKFAYSADSSFDSVAGYTVNATTGALTAIAGSPFAVGDAPYSLAVDQSSQFLHVANINSSSISAFKINATSGVLTKISGSPYTGIEAPDWVTVDPRGRFLLVGNDCCLGSTPPPGISVLTINPKIGALKLVKESPFEVPNGVGNPSSLTVDPTGKFVYSANGSSSDPGGAVAYSITASTGALKLLGAAVPGGSAPWGITTDTAGKYVYMTNNDTTISGYSIDPTTGGLTKLAGSPFAASVSTRGIVTDPSGKFLYLSNGSQILGYSINADTGAITPLATSPYSGGGDPLDLTVIGTVQ